MARLLLAALLLPLVRLPSAILRRTERELLAMVGALVGLAAFACFAVAAYAALRNGALDGFRLGVPDWRAGADEAAHTLSGEYPTAGRVLLEMVRGVDAAVAAANAAGGALARWAGPRLPAADVADPIRIWFAPAVFLAASLGLRRFRRRFPRSTSRHHGDGYDGGYDGDGGDGGE